MAVWLSCMLLSCVCVGLFPLASSCCAVIRPHCLLWSGGLAVGVWQLSIAWAPSMSVTATKSATLLHAAVGTVSLEPASQSSSCALSRTSNAPGLTSFGVEQPGPETSQQSPLHAVQ